jgi:hypothetical protein
MRRRMYAYDAALVLWAALWLVVGTLVHREVTALADASVPVVDAAAALEETAQGIAQLDEIPFVGEIANLPAIERSAREAALSARRSAVETNEGVKRLAWLLGGSIALVPTVPVLVLWLVVRRDWRRRR